MWRLRIHALCSNRFFEVLTGDIKSAELTVEDAVSGVLLDLFGEGGVDDVAIRFAARSRTGLQHCAIQIHAQFSYQCCDLLTCSKEYMSGAIEKHACAILKELFGAVYDLDVAVLDPVPCGA